MFKPKYFQLYELVPQVDFERYGNRLWYVFDDRILQAADVLRGLYGPMVVNDWHDGGSNHFRGFRPAGCTVGATFSQHRYGRALDLIPQETTAEKIRGDIIADPEIVTDWMGDLLITAMETGVSWLHIDCRNHDVDRYGLKLFKA